MCLFLIVLRLVGFCFSLVHIRELNNLFMFYLENENFKLSVENRVDRCLQTSVDGFI